jgi:hypothetical protein
VLEKMGEMVEITISYFGTVDEDGTVKCPHGESEVEGNIVQLCAAKSFPDGYLAMNVCMARDYEAIPENWKACAQEAGLDPAPIEACREGEGLELLKASFEHSKQIGARSSPDLIVNDERHEGCRSARAVEALICDALPEGARPEDCPSFPDVRVTVITDSACKACPKIIKTTMATLEFLIAKLEVETLEWADASALAEEAGITRLPAFVFEESLSEDPCYDYISKEIEERGGHLVLERGEKFAPFDPSN